MIESIMRNIDLSNIKLHEAQIKSLKVIYKNEEISLKDYIKLLIIEVLEEQIGGQYDRKIS